MLLRGRKAINEDLVIRQTVEVDVGASDVSNGFGYDDGFRRDVGAGGGVEVGRGDGPIVRVGRHETDFGGGGGSGGKSWS